MRIDTKNSVNESCRCFLQTSQRIPFSRVHERGRGCHCWKGANVGSRYFFFSVTPVYTRESTKYVRSASSR